MRDNRKVRFITNNKGFLLINVLIVMVFLSILFASANFILQSNLKQIVMQERSMKAHYIARSGAELAYTAIADQDNIDLLEEIATKNNELSGKKQTLQFNEENAKVYLTSWYDDGNIIIKAESELIDLSAKSTIYLIFEKNNPKISNWQSNIN